MPCSCSNMTRVPSRKSSQFSVDQCTVLLLSPMVMSFGKEITDTNNQQEFTFQGVWAHPGQGEVLEPLG